MSRVGKYPVPVPDGVSVEIAGGRISASGVRGVLSMALSEEVSVALADNRVTVAPNATSKRARAMWGTTRARINNLLTGVSKGFRIDLEISGVGYRAAVDGDRLSLALGYSQPVIYPIPEGITARCERPTAISIEGADRQRVGQVAAEIRACRPPEPFKGKGIRYAHETIRRKEGKKK